MVQRTKKSCSIDGCEKIDILRRGWCSKHYWRWRKHGDPLVTIVQSDPDKAFALRTKKDGSCLIWTGSISSAGYGRMTVKREVIYAHRFAWEKVRGAIPEGATIDHTCFNRQCVNADHLRLLTHRENTQHRLIKSAPNKSGYRGVWWSKQNKGYCAMVESLGKKYYLGTFDDPREAGIVAAQKRRELGFPDSSDDIELLGK